MTKHEVIYFSFGGRGDYLRLGLTLAGVPFKDTRLSYEEFGAKKAAGFFTFGQVPVLVVDGKQMAQTRATCRYIASLAPAGKLYPTDAFAAAEVDQWIDLFEDLLTELVFTIVPSAFGLEKPDVPAHRAHLAQKSWPAGLAATEKALKASSSGWLVGGSMTYADIFLAGMTKWIQSGTIDHIPASLLDATPACREHLRRFLAVPEVAEFFAPTPEVELVYFNMPGRAEPIRLAAKLGGVELKDTRITGEEFGQMKASGQLRFGQLPVLYSNGRQLAQSRAILRYIGRLSKGKIYPTDPLEAQEVDQWIDHVEDLTLPIGITNYSERFGFPDLDKAAMRERLVNGVFKKGFEAIEKHLSTSTSGWLVGDSMTIADIQLAMSSQFLTSGMLEGIPKTLLDDYPSIKKLRGQFVSNPTVQAHFAPKQ